MPAVPRLKIVARSHVRLWTAIGCAALVFLACPARLPSLTRVLIAWNSGVFLFLALIYRWMRSMSPRQMSARFAEEDPSAGAILAAITIAALLSIAAIVALLSTVKPLDAFHRTLHLALAATTIAGSWLLLPTMFTLRYADLYYSAAEDRRPLAFPATPLPDFTDFTYFSLTIAAACQTSDVSTSRGEIRRLVIAHTLVSFVFNASILGFAINVTAGLVGG